MNLIAKWLGLQLLFLCICAGVYAQGTQANITGTVSEEKGAPIGGATVLVRNESTGFRATTLTNAKGEYILKQLPLGGPYTIVITAVGYGEQKKTDYALNQGDQLRVNFSMEKAATEMKAVEVVANSLKNSIKNMGSGTSVTAKDINKLPVNGRNFTSLVDLSPLSSGGSLSGQLASSTNFTIDGMTSKGTIAAGTPSGAYSISMEAIREFKVITNQYDVTYGRSGGGTISTVTKAGTNKLTGSVFTFMRNDKLSSPYDIRGVKRNQPYSTYQYGFSLSGPIIKDKVHFFIAWDHQADSRPLNIANIQSPTDEGVYRTNQATLDKFLEIARAKYGVASSPQFGSFDKKKRTEAVFARIDWQLNAKNLLTLRNNFIYDLDNQSDGDNSGINLYEVYASRKTFNNSLMASLRTMLGPRLTNELKLQHFYVNERMMTNSQLPAANIPRAIIENVSTTTSDGKSVTNSFQLGGQRYTPEWFKDHVFQLVNNLYFNTGKINYTAGIDIMYTKMKSLYGSEMNGRFYFTGLDNFNNQTAYRYARDVSIVPDPSVPMNTIAAGIYGQLETKLAKGLELMGGLRIDYTNYTDKGNFNKTVYDELGIRTDHGITTLQLQPRFQFTWDVNEKRKDIIRFGAGIFGSDLNNYSMINNMLFDGTKTASIDITGALVPQPNFPGYRANPATAPGAELFNNPAISKLYTINTNSKDTRVPVVYKTNFSYSHFFTDRLRLGVSAYGSWARNNYMYVDRNMVQDPYFRLTAEGNRGVYVPADKITKSNGVANWLDSRKSNKVGRVLELISEGKINQFSFVIDGTYRYYKDGQVSFSYTWNDSKDNTSYNGNVANTATLALMVKDDPRDLSTMTYSDNQFRHKVIFYGTAPTIWGVSVGLRFSGMAGTRYSLAVNGNMNGDFVNSNDLAYVYDPADPKTPAVLRTGIQAILDNPDARPGLKNYIRDNIGRVAERNGGINGFYGSFDLRIAKKFRLYKSNNIEASIDIFNLANLFSKKWGAGYNLGKQSIYNIKSFDDVSKQFVYSINGTTGVSNRNGNPYQVQLGIRYSF
jgi:hypothetical protein